MEVLIDAPIVRRSDRLIAKRSIGRANLVLKLNG